MVVQSGRGSDEVQGLSVRAIATVSPWLLDFQHFGKMQAEPAARLIEVWLALMLRVCAHIGCEVDITLCRSASDGRAGRCASCYRITIDVQNLFSTSTF